MIELLLGSLALAPRPAYQLAHCVHEADKAKHAAGEGHGVEVHHQDLGLSFEEAPFLADAGDDQAGGPLLGQVLHGEGDGQHGGGHADGEAEELFESRIAEAVRLF